MFVRFVTEAEEEVDQIFNYLENQLPGLGQRFINDLDQMIRAIGRNPLRFGRVETLPDDIPCRRALLRKFRYVVIFEVVQSEVAILAVKHGSREPNYWLGRRTRG